MTVRQPAVSARPAERWSRPADGGLVDLRGGGAARAGTFVFEARERVSVWHHHDVHQIEYAVEGVAEVETATGHHLLPPQQAIWIPAGLRHRTTLQSTRSLAVFFDPAMVDDVDGRAHVLAATPVLREMMIHAARWPIWRPSADPVADAFFEALARLVGEWRSHPVPLSLPTTGDPVVADVMTYTQAHLAEVTSSSVCRAVGISERTLRRRFASTGMSWRAYLRTSRLLRAMALLADPHRTVAAVAADVGFDSVSSFTRAFRQLAGETPTAWRDRTAAGAGPQGAGAGGTGGSSNTWPG